MAREKELLEGKEVKGRRSLRGEAGELLGPRAWFGMLTLDSKVLAFGGMSPLRDQYSNILQLDTETEQWVELEDRLQTTRGISSFATAVVFQDEICV